MKFLSAGIFLPIINGSERPAIQGREDLAEVSGGGSNNCESVGWIEQGVHHIYVNHIITPTPEGPTGTVDMLMIGLGGDPNKIEHDGHYEEVYVKTPQGWHIKQRTHYATYDTATRRVGAVRAIRRLRIAGQQLRNGCSWRVRVSVVSRLRQVRPRAGLAKLCYTSCDRVRGLFGYGRTCT